ncbi:uncharacterized protein LOC112347140 isoform X2 [Selaginella moellendorffii]|uniref:uncharacterized protein LOC112347140 isoform X2 n=1 Tax=Selaginella moellendorffii TaxID=88036 RepID=UPI000D1CDB85|nr:uncharacterized protein LOC112347140 isoform X2 [Selaginella moellendorffii]|eukprot:XP_024533283.1 uncharacterized protein LOC112347140 isoform X2 [Selaginella moellendorffii]
MASPMQAAKMPCLLWSSWTTLHSRAQEKQQWRSWRSQKSFRPKVLEVSNRLSASLISPCQGQPLFCLIASCAALAQVSLVLTLQEEMLLHGQVLEGRTKWGEHLSSPVLSMASGMLLSSLQVIPTAAPVYENIAMPMAVALTLLETDVQRAFTDAGSTLKAFWIGAAGTILGTLVAFWIVGRHLGPDGWKIASCLCASYVGGSINYAATAQALELSSGSTLAAGIAADNLAMVLYFGIIMWIPADTRRPPPHITREEASELDAKPTSETVIVSLAVAAASCTIGNALAALLPSTFAGCGLAIMALVASAFSAVAARACHSQSHSRSARGTSVAVFAGSQVIGGALMLLFFAVVGASCSIRDAVSAGWPLFTFILLLLLTHLGFTLGLGSQCKIPMRALLVASNANIGGPATAAAMANARCWKELVDSAFNIGGNTGIHDWNGHWMRAGNKHAENHDPFVSFSFRLCTIRCQRCVSCFAPRG